MSPVDLDKPIYHLEQRPRMGHILVTFYEEESALGSLLLDPDRHGFIIEKCDEFVKALESSRKQRAEKERARLDGRKSKRDDQ